MEAGWFKRNDNLAKDENCAVISEENFLTLEKRITNFAAKKGGAFDSKEKRSLWRELQELKYYLPDARNSELVSLFPQEKIQELETLLTPKLKPSAIEPYRVLRLISLLCAVLWNFPVLIVLSTLRLFNVLWTKLGFTKGHMPTDHVQRFFCSYWLVVLGINVTSTGKQYFHEWINNASLGFFQHCSNLDSTIIHSISPVVFKWIGKKSLLKVPLLGQVILAYDTMIGIDRSNIKDAINTLHDVKTAIDQKQISVAISPEGTRSKLGQLLDFKKGPFHLALDAKVPIVPIVIYGAFELLPPHQPLPGSGNVTLHFSKPIPYSEYKDMDYNELTVALRKHMLKIIESNYPTPQKPSLLFLILHYISFPLNFYMVYLFYYVYFYSWIRTFF